MGEHQRKAIGTIRWAAGAFLLLAALGLLVGSSGADAREAESRLEKARIQLRTKKDKAARRGYEELRRSGGCQGAVCAAGLAILAHCEGDAGQAVERAREAARLAGEGPALTDWECNELGVLLYGAAGSDPKALADAEALLRRGWAQQGRAWNVGLNLVSVLELMGRKKEAAALNQEIETAGGPIIDVGYSLIGEFQGPG